MNALDAQILPAKLAPKQPAKPESRLQLRLVISIPALLILVALAYGLVSYLSFFMFWDDLDKSGGGEIARQLLRIHMNALILLAFISVGAGLVLASTILRPIRALQEATQQVTPGRLDLPHASQIPSMPELNDLSHSFNRMIDHLNLSIGEHNRRLVAGIPIGVLTTGMDGCIGAVSPLACEFLGLPAERIIGLKLGELASAVSPPAHALVEYLMRQVDENPAPANAEVTLTNAGAEKSQTVNSTLLRDGAGEAFGFMFSFREASRRRNLTAQLSRSDQLAALGTFTLGLAHELRNPLGAIKGFSQLLLLERDLPPRAADFLGRMVHEVDRVDGLMSQLSDLADQPPACRVPTRLSEVLEAAADQARQAVAQDRAQAVTLLREFQELPPLRLDFDRLVQAMARIVQNAYEFTPAGGRITLRTAREERPEGALWLLEVRNSGSTLAKEDLPNIFEPFFTTKDKATGLGLTIARQIIAQNGGRLEAAMEDGDVVFRALLAQKGAQGTPEPETTGGGES